MTKLSASGVKKLVVENKGKAPKKTESLKGIKSSILTDLPSAIKQLDSIRTGDKDRRAVDINFAQFVQEKWGFAASDNESPDSFYAALGIDPSRHTIESLMTMPEFPEGYRWIVPEVIREAIRLGLRKNPLYPNLIAAEENVTQPTVIMPSINQSDATPKRIGEAETIPVGSVSFNEKSVKLHKVGVGLKVTDEVRQYVSLNVLSIFLQDVGNKLNLAMDTLLLETLINGDQKDGSNAAAVVGVQTPYVTGDLATGLQYIDYLRATARMGRLGKLPSTIVSAEDAFLHTYQLPEFKGREGAIRDINLNVRTPLPQNMNYDIHGAAPEGNRALLVDPASAAIKLNSASMRVESERIAERQITGTYVTLTTGFANLFNDGRLILDGSQNITAAPFPAWFDVATAEKESIK